MADANWIEGDGYDNDSFYNNDDNQWWLRNFFKCTFFLEKFIPSSYILVENANKT